MLNLRPGNVPALIQAAKLRRVFGDLDGSYELFQLAFESTLQSENDERAWQLTQMGVRIPDDISVVGFNDTIGSVLHPALTTAREFSKEQGRHLAKFVLRRIQWPDTPPQRVVIPTELVRRDSVRILHSVSH